LIFGGKIKLYGFPHINAIIEYGLTIGGKTIMGHSDTDYLPPNHKEIPGLMGGILYNRGNFVLGAPKLDMSFRVQVTDKRDIPRRRMTARQGSIPVWEFITTQRARTCSTGFKASTGFPRG